MDAASDSPDDALKAWNEFLAIPDLSLGAISRMVQEGLKEGDFEGVRHMLGHPEMTERKDVRLAVEPHLARTLCNLQSDPLWREGRFPGSVEDSLTPREKQAWELCHDWIEGLPSGPGEFKSEVLAKCLKAVATGFNPGGIDFFLKRGAKFLKTGPQVLRTPLLAALEDTRSVDQLTRLLPHLSAILPTFSFDILDLATAKQRGYPVETVQDLSDNEKAKGAEMTDTALYLRDLICDGVGTGVGEGVMSQLAWIRERTPEHYALPYNQLWNYVVAIGDGF